MEALMASSFHPSLNHRVQVIKFKPMLYFSQFSSIPTSFSSSKSKIYTVLSSSSSAVSSTTEIEAEKKEEKFDWFSQWYPVMPECDLDKKVPHAKKVLGLDLVVWWDRNEKAWKVFDDMCPHRLAPLSEGRIDQWGRLQCVYHGWCFNGSGDCKFIPQAALDGPPVHTFNKACAKVYPSTVQNDIVWFWPKTEPQYKDIILKKKPPYIPELDDPSYTKTIGNRDLPYGYEVLTENLMDPAHVPYAHYKILKLPQPKVKLDKEGGVPIEMSVPNIGLYGFTSKREWGSSKFMAPCVYYAFPELVTDKTSTADRSNGSASSSGNNKEPSSRVAKRRVVLIFICIPVSPGKSRVIWTFPRNFAVWIDRIVPRWIFHLNQNLVFDSDLNLLHLEERRIMAVGPSNWQKAFFLPTKSDANVIAFRKWLNKYSGCQLNWGHKFSQALPPTPPKEQLMDRYWTHVVNCQSCSVAYKALNVLELVLQVISIVSLGFVAATKERLPTPARIALVTAALLCFAASRWSSHFIYKNFHFHDYNHAHVK